jgi:hypothetical protein
MNLKPGDKYMQFEDAGEAYLKKLELPPHMKYASARGIKKNL